MKRCMELVQRFGKKALFIASAFAVTKSTVAVLDAQWYQGMCVGSTSCYITQQCSGDGNIMYNCLCQGNMCRTVQIC
jgi:hypothetical protein